MQQESTDEPKWMWWEGAGLWQPEYWGAPRDKKFHWDCEGGFLKMRLWAHWGTPGPPPGPPRGLPGPPVASGHGSGPVLA